MSRFRRWVLAVGTSAVLSGPVFLSGCGGTPEPVGEERKSLVGKTVIVKRLKVKQYVAGSDHSFKPYGEFATTTGVVKSEETIDNQIFCLVHAGKDDYWLKDEDIVAADESQIFFEKQIAENPKAFEPYYIRANAAIETGKLDRAILELNEAIKNKSTSAQPIYLRATIFEQQGEYAKALADYEKVLTLEGGQLKAFVGKSRCMNELGQTDQALLNIDRALKVDPKSVPCYVLRAEIWASKGDKPAALLDFQRATEADPHNLEVYLARGQFFMKLKDYEKALGDFLKVLKSDPEQVTAMTQTATLLAAGPNVKLRDSKKAFDLARKACELTDGKDPLTLDALAMAHAAKGEFDDAIKNQKAALEDPQYIKNHSDLGKKKLAIYKSKLPYMLD
jgi:tetratricopeptide (TPR) repeat protein